VPARTDLSRDRLSVLLLCDASPSHAPNVLEHIRALQRFSRHRVDTFNPLGVRHSRLLRMDNYDVVVVHYTVFVLHDAHLSPWFREQLAGYQGLKVQFVQDEYRRVDAMTARMRELGIDLLFSSVPPEAVARVYGPRLRDVEILPTLTGYVPAELEGRPRPLFHDRPLDVVYRGRSIPYWLGRLGQDKIVIGREFLARAASTGLRCDIAWSEADRIYGDAWYRFLGSSRTTLGTESGASIVDFDGSLQERTEAFLRSNPTATFGEVEREILLPFEGNAVIQAISPRVFEAAALGTAMVNFTGRYSGVIEPWLHYIPLEKDFSNFDEVVAAIRDDDTLDAVASRAHVDLVSSGRYSLERFVRDFEHEIEARVGPANRRPRPRFPRMLNKKLFALEQFRSTAQRTELPLVVHLRNRADERTERRLIRRFPQIEALALRAESEGPRDRSERVLHDLVRLAAAVAAHARELPHYGPPFDVRVELDDDDRRLTLVGTREPSQGAAERIRLRGRVASAIRERRLEEMVWNNSAVGGSLTFVTVPLSSLDVGYHVISAAHRFTTLPELARQNPDGVIAALAPLFEVRPEAPVHELDRRVLALVRILSRPGPVTARATAALRGVLGSKELRQLLAAYLRSREARAEAPIDLLLEDLFKLKLLGQAATIVELDADRKRLLYRSNGNIRECGITLDVAAVQSLTQIIWDHSAVGSSITSSERPRVSVRLDGGVHEFQALTRVARRFPAAAAVALKRAAGCE
jgi:hypothetical protein